MQVSHQFIDCDDGKSVTSDNEAIICIGSTGTGKSSLIKLFCGDYVKVGHSTKSKTMKSGLFRDVNSSQIYWLDSQGANDSSGTDDDKVLSDVLRKLYDETVTKIKVIWFVSGDMCREKKEFQIQAAFIKALGNNIWNSCLIVKKGGLLTPSVDGVLAAAKRYGAEIKDKDGDRLLGFTGIEYGCDMSKDKAYVIINNLQVSPQTKRKALCDGGYLTNEEIISQVKAKLSCLSSVELTFIVKKCEKCGVKGDPRFVYAPCHSKLEKYHSKSTVPYHDGCLKDLHLGQTQNYHDGAIEYYHTGHLRRFHTGSIRTYHYGSVSTSTSYSYYHTGDHSFDKRGRAEWSCCGRGAYSTRGCRKRTTYSSSWSCCGYSSGSSGCQSKYGCCSGSVSSDGCRKEWNCCGASENNAGCQSRYKCCQTYIGSKGCKVKYGCCGSTVDSTGCKKQWVCCNGSESNGGCKRKYECCGSALGSIGCKNRCQSCHQVWGISAGCIKTQLY